MDQDNCIVVDFKVETDRRLREKFDLLLTQVPPTVISLALAQIKDQER